MDQLVQHVLQQPSSERLLLSRGRWKSWLKAVEAKESIFLLSKNIPFGLQEPNGAACEQLPHHEWPKPADCIRFALEHGQEPQFLFSEETEKSCLLMILKHENCPVTFLQFLKFHGSSNRHNPSRFPRTDVGVSYL